MTFKKTLCTLVAATMGLTGCTEIGADSKVPEDVTIYGKPISVKHDSENNYNYGSLVAVFEVDGEILLTYKYGKGLRNLKALTSSALIQSEIDDGDQELVKLTGRYEGKQFELSSIKANGYEIKFSE